MEDSWSAASESAARRKSEPNEQPKLLTVDSATIARSNSFKIPKSGSRARLTPGSAEGATGGSVSLPTTPVEMAQAGEQTSTAMTAGNTQRAKTAWTKVRSLI